MNNNGGTLTDNDVADSNNSIDDNSKSGSDVCIHHEETGRDKGKHAHTLD